MLSEEIINRILERSKEKISYTQIAREFNVSFSTVKKWVLRGKYKSLLRHDYDFKLFETMNDLDFANNYNVCLAVAQHLRAKYAPHTTTKEVTSRKIKARHDNLDKEILEYILKNNGSITIQGFLDNKNKISHDVINRARFIKIAKKNDIKIVFKRELKIKNNSDSGESNVQ